MHRLISCLLTFFFLSCSITSHALTWQGKVVGVSDGDTITVMHDGKGEKIRLYGVDCPEKAQDFGQKARQFSSDMVFGKTVDVESVVTDRYGRTIGIVRVEGKCLSEELILNGLGWVYTRYCDKSFCSQWKQLEEKAKSAKTGLWSVTDPTPPWDFRHGTKSSKVVSPISSGDALTGDYHGNLKSHAFHAAGCSSYNCKNCTAVFKSRDEAISAGYRPCGMCRP